LLTSYDPPWRRKSLHLPPFSSRVRVPRKKFQTPGDCHAEGEPRAHLAGQLWVMVAWPGCQKLPAPRRGPAGSRWIPPEGIGHRIKHVVLTRRHWRGFRITSRIMFEPQSTSMFGQQFSDGVTSWMPAQRIRASENRVNFFSRPGNTPGPYLPNHRPI